MSAKTKMSSLLCLVLCLGVVACLIVAHRAAKAAAAKEQTTVGVIAPALNPPRKVWRRNYFARNISSFPQGALAEKTVDQTGKNIQVLKGLPESQLFLVMNFVAT